MTGTTNEPSKVGGNMKAAGGNVKEQVGSLIGNERMQGSGAAQRAEGNVEHDTAQAKGYAEGAGDGLIGSIKKTVGDWTGNKQMEAEGHARETKGDVKKAANS